MAANVIESKDQWHGRLAMMRILEFRRKDDLRLDPGALFILAAPIGIFLFGDLLFGRLAASQDIAFMGIADWPSVQRSEASHRALVLTGFLLVASVSTMAAIVFVADFCRLFGPRGRRTLLIGLAIAVAAILLSLVILTGRFIPPTRNYLGGSFVENVLRGAGSDALQGRGDLAALLVGLLRAVQICLLVAVPATILGAISCLAVPASRLPEKTRNELRDLQRRRLSNYLRLSALMLTAGLLFMLAWMRWPSFALSGPALDAFVRQVNAVGLYFGVNYSLVIVAYYVPVASLMRTSEGELADDDQGAADVVYGPLFTKILTVAAPALVGAAGPLVDLFVDS